MCLLNRWSKKFCLVAEINLTGTTGANEFLANARLSTSSSQFCTSQRIAKWLSHYPSFSIGQEFVIRPREKTLPLRLPTNAQESEGGGGGKKGGKCSWKDADRWGKNHQGNCTKKSCKITPNSPGFPPADLAEGYASLAKKQHDVLTWGKETQVSS